MRTCVVCEVGIEHRNDDALTCSKVCRWRMQRIRRKNKQISCSAGTSKSCEGCESIIRDRAPQARFCSDLCRQETANRNARQARLLDKPDRNCQWCNGPMAASMKITASYCGPVCRKAAEKSGIATRSPNTDFVSPTVTVLIEIKRTESALSNERR